MWTVVVLSPNGFALDFWPDLLGRQLQLHLRSLDCVRAMASEKTSDSELTKLSELLEKAKRSGYAAS